MYSRLPIPNNNKGITEIKEKRADRKNKAENKDELLYMLLSAFIPLITVTPFRDLRQKYFTKLRNPQPPKNVRQQSTFATQFTTTCPSKNHV
jgi:hypothetical protein